MTQTDIKNALSDFIASELLTADTMVDDDETLLSDGVVDSLGMIRLVGFIEDSFAIEIPPEHLIIENFQSINTISGYVRRHLDTAD